MTRPAADYRFLRQPRWVAFTALVLGLVVLMLNLALWQLRRLDERRDRNDRIAAALAAEAVPAGSDGALTEWRTVTATGRFDPAAQVLIRNRSFQGQPGYHVVTPLVLADGRALLVNRGWVPLAAAGDGDTRSSDATSSDATSSEGGSSEGGSSVPAPPTGQVTVTGRVRDSQRKSRFFSPTDPADGTLAQLYRVDIARIGQQVPYPLLPAYVELLALESGGPAPDPVGQPALVPPPEPGDGPHLSYAGQWVLFAGCAVAGWVIVVRRRARAAPATATP